MSENIKLKVNNTEVEVPDGTTILDAATKAGIRIPTLCYLKDINGIGACRMCLVEVTGARGLMASCVTPATDGMEVFTHTRRTINTQRQVVELILSNHPQNCVTCAKNTYCELQALAAEKGAGFKDFIVPMMLEKAQIHPVLMGIVFVLLMAASVTTLSAIILTACSTLVKDFFGTIKPNSDEKKVGMNIKLLCLAFAVVSFFVANTSTPILDMMSYSWGIISGSFLAPYVFALYYKGVNKIGAWGGILTGFCIAFVPAACKLLNIAGVGAEGVVKLMGQGPQFAVIAGLCSLAVCFLVSVVVNKAKGRETAAA